MAKTALLVEFTPRTRIVVDIPDGQTLEDYLNDSNNFDNVVKAARANMTKDIENYLFGDNIGNIEEDTECPYGSIDSNSNTEDSWVNYERGGFGFRNYFNAGFNEDTCQFDEEGVDVYEKDAQGNYHYINISVSWVSTHDIANMTDDEFDEFCFEHGIM